MCTRPLSPIVFLVESLLCRLLHPVYTKLVGLDVNVDSFFVSFMLLSIFAFVLKCSQDAGD